MHKGFDASIMWTDHINDFNYSVGGNITYSRFWDWEQYKPRFSNSWDEYRNSIWHRVGYVNWGYEAVGRFDSCRHPIYQINAMHPSILHRGCYRRFGTDVPFPNLDSMMSYRSLSRQRF